MPKTKRGHHRTKSRSLPKRKWMKEGGGKVGKRKWREQAAARMKYAPGRKELGNTVFPEDVE